MKRFISILTGIFLSGTVFAATLGGYGDVPSDHESARPIGYLKDAGIMTGYPDGTFGAERILNRAELMKLLVGAAEGTPDVETYSNCFPDIGTEWFAPYVCFAEKKGWVSGYPDGSFRPGNSVNVVEALKMLINSRGYTVPTMGALAWFAPYVQVAQLRSIADLADVALDTPLLRKRAAEYLYRALLSEGDVSFSLGTAASCLPKSINTLMLDTSYVTEGGVIVDVQQTLRGRGKRECLIAYNVNPYAQISLTHPPMMLFPMGHYTTENLGQVTQRMSMQSIQDTAFFVSGYPTGELTTHVWEYNLQTGTLRMVADNLNGEAAVITPDQTFALYINQDATKLFLLNLRSGEEKLVETAEAPFVYESGAYALSPNGEITYTIKDTSDGSVAMRSVYLTELFDI